MTIRRQRGARKIVFKEPSHWDRGLIYGAALALGLIVLSLSSSQSLRPFIHIPSLLLVLGGTLAAGLINFSAADLLFAFKRTIRILRSSLQSPRARIEYFVRLIQIVRMHGVMALESEASRITDPFIKRALELAADAQQEKDIQRILETERLALADQERRAIDVLEALGNFAPALGLIGTLLGLVQMLSLLNDPSAVGPAMALALLTTLYGAVLANLVFLPLAGKLRLRNEEETLLRTLTIEGTLSLLKSENPILLEQRLITFLPGFAESRLAA